MARRGGQTRQLTTAKWHRIKGTHPRGLEVDGCVLRRRPGGYLIKIGRGTSLILGYLREGDMGAGRGGAPTRLNEGDTVRLYVKDYDDERMTLALTAERSDRERVAEIFDTASVGDRLVGRVVAHAPAGVFVRLDGGFDALIPFQEIPHTGNQDADDLLWPEDRVAAAVYDVDRTKGHIHLSVTRMLLDENHEGAPAQDLPDGGQGQQATLEVGLFELPRAANRRCIVVLDDGQDNVDGLCAIMGRCGHTTYPVTSFDEFTAIVRERDPDCAVVDVFIHGRSVLEDVLAACRQTPRLKIVICTGLPEPATCARVVQERGRIIEALVKPVDIPRLVACVDSLVAAESFEIEEDAHLFAQHEEEHHLLVQQRLQVGKTPDQVVFELFEEARRIWGGVPILILHRPRHSGEPVIARSKGIDQDRFRRLHTQLKYSPIGDVLKGGQPEYIEDLGDEDINGAGYIRELIPCASMVGVPIAIMGHVEYGLFVFGESGRPFSQEDMNRALGLSWRFGGELERAANMEALARDHIRLAGANLFASVAHETSNAIDAFVIRVGNVAQQRLPALTRGALSQPEQLALAGDVRYLLEHAEKASATMKTFLKTLSKQPDALTELFLLVHEIVDALEPHAQLAGVTLQCGLPPALATRRYSDLPLRQSVFNLVLNAIQHLEGKRLGRKAITISGGIDGDKEFPVWLSVADTGFGIHEELRERIFEPFFSTRPDGSGLGLALARWFVHLLGGRVFVQDTVRFEGTTFRIELPEPAVR